LALFGSVLTDNSTPDSDIDVLVEFKPEHVPGFSFFSMEEELSGLLGRRVERHTPKFLSRYFRERSSKRLKSSMPKDNRVLLHHMLDAARKAVDFLQGRSRKDFESDEMLALATIRFTERNMQKKQGHFDPAFDI